MNIRDIARIAGVAVSTVSRVMNNHQDVGPETRERILKVMEETGYVPNSNARNLKRTSSASIGVMIKGRYNPFFLRMIEAIENEITNRHYSMILHYNHDSANDIEAAVELIKEKRLEGLICLGGNFNQIDDSYLLDLKTPLVLASTDLEEASAYKDFSSVGVGNEKAAFGAVSHLLELGHKQIAMITSDETDICIGTLRKKGYFKALKAYGIPENNALVGSGLYTFDSGYVVAQEILNRCPDVTAFFAISDIMAIGAMRAIHEKGLRIPEDIAVVGFDGLDYAAFCHPTLTTVQQPVEEIGVKSAEILFALIDKKAENQHLILETELIVRNSTQKM